MIFARSACATSLVPWLVLKEEKATRKALYEVAKKIRMVSRTKSPFINGILEVENFI